VPATKGLAPIHALCLKSFRKKWVCDVTGIAVCPLNTPLLECFLKVI